MARQTCSMLEGQTPLKQLTCVMTRPTAEEEEELTAACGKSFGYTLWAISLSPSFCWLLQVNVHVLRVCDIIIGSPVSVPEG